MAAARCCSIPPSILGPTSRPTGRAAAVARRRRGPVERRHLQELLDLRVDAISQPERYLLLAATGDEVLDYRDMLAAFPGARTRLIQGSDHGISEFADYLDEVLEFCGYGPGGVRPGA